MAQNKVIQNAKWIIGCKIMQAVINLFIGMISARYLGPSGYGLINYAASVTAFVVPIMQLGLRSTLVQEFIQKPDREGEILGTAIAMNVISAVACMVMVVTFAGVINRNDPASILVCALYSITLLFQAVEIVQYWFQSKLKSQYPSLAMLGGYIAASSYKIYLLVTQKSVYWFVLTHSIEAAIIGVALVVSYCRISDQKLRVSYSMAKELFSRSKYYIVSSLMVMVFQNTDHVMLKMMAGDVENGYYSAAVTCAGIFTFVFAAMIDSARPSVLECRRKNMEQFESRLAGLYSVIIYTALLQSIAFSLLAKPAMLILYGSAYSASIPVLRVVVWYAAFSYMGTIRNIWILSEGKQSILWIINLSGALANVVLNACFIPAWGACGAALASVLTQFFTNFIIGFLVKPIRPSNRILLKGLNPRAMLCWLKD